MDKPITFSEWLGTQGNMVLLHANCCRIAYEAGQQSQQAKVEELDTQLLAYKKFALNMGKKIGSEALRISAKKWNMITAAEKRLIQDLWDVFNNEADKALSVEQSLKGEGTPNINIDEKGECRHFSTTMFHEGKAECFHCDAVVNEEREVIGKQKKADWTVSKVKTYKETWGINNKKERDQ